MGAMDHTLKQTVPYYSTMKRAGAFRQPQKPQKRQKRTTLTEYSQNGQKAILKPHVTVNQAAKKLYDYEQTGLSPHEVANLVEQVQNLTRRVNELWSRLRITDMMQNSVRMDETIFLHTELHSVKNVAKS